MGSRIRLWDPNSFTCMKIVLHRKRGGGMGRLQTLLEPEEWKLLSEQEQQAAIKQVQKRLVRYKCEQAVLRWAAPCCPSRCTFRR